MPNGLLQCPNTESITNIFPMAFLPWEQVLFSGSYGQMNTEPLTVNFKGQIIPLEITPRDHCRGLLRHS